MTQIWSSLNTISPYDIAKGSIKKIVWLRCLKNPDHPDYLQSPNVISRGVGCPYCASRKVCESNSLSHFYPQVKDLWSRKNTLPPSEYTPYSEKKVWWKCPEGKHDDFLRIISNSVIYDFRCPKCSKENESHIEDLTGQRFGRLTVKELDQEKTRAKNRTYWICKCECGRETSVLAGHLKSGKIQSCGCLHREIVSHVDHWDWNSVPPAVERGRIRKSPEYLQWREAVLKRDNYTCQKCGSNADLQVHHKNNFIDYPDQRIAEDNGITLCKKCHLKGYPNSFHTIYGIVHNTEKQIEEFIKNKT